MTLQKLKTQLFQYLPFRCLKGGVRALLDISFCLRAAKMDFDFCYALQFKW